MRPVIYRPIEGTSDNERAEWPERETLPLGTIELYDAVREFEMACGRGAKVLKQRIGSGILHAAVDAVGAWISADAQWQVLNDRLGVTERCEMTLRMSVQCRTLVHLLDVARVELLDVLGAATVGDLCVLLRERCDRLRQYLSEVGPTVSTVARGPDDPALS